MGFESAQFNKAKEYAREANFTAYLINKYDRSLVEKMLGRNATTGMNVLHEEANALNELADMRVERSNGSLTPQEAVGEESLSGKYQIEDSKIAEQFIMDHPELQEYVNSGEFEKAFSMFQDLSQEPDFPKNSHWPILRILTEVK